MKKVILLSALIAVSQLAMAKDCAGQKPFDRHTPPSIEQRVEHMTKILSLTPEQASQLTSTFESLEPQHQALREQMKTLREQEKTAFDAILTDEQKAVIKEMHRGPKGAPERDEGDDV